MNNNYTQSELRHLPLKEIAKMVRKNLKAEFGKSMKFSVRCRGYNALSVTVKKATPEMFMSVAEFEEGHSRYKLSNPAIYENLKYRFDRRDYIALKESVYDKIVEIVNEYNFDNSDPYTDYCDVNYFTNIDGVEIELI